MNGLLILLALLLLAAIGALLWLLRQRTALRQTLDRAEEENRQLRELLQTGTQIAQDDLSQLRQLRHDLRHYLLLTEDPSAADEVAALRQVLDAMPSSTGSSWAFSALERRYQERPKRWGFRPICTSRPPRTGTK